MQISLWKGITISESWVIALAKKFITIYDVQDIWVNKQLSSLQFKKRSGKADSGLSGSAIYITYDMMYFVDYPTHMYKKKERFSTLSNYVYFPGCVMVAKL